MEFRWSGRLVYLDCTYRWCPEKKAYILVQAEAKGTKDQAMPQLRRLADTAVTIADLGSLKDSERQELERVATGLEYGE